MKNTGNTVILASASPRRRDLLEQIDIALHNISPADIDENPHKNEKPRDLAVRLASEKALAIAAKNPQSIIIGADTVVACGTQILDKADDRDYAHMCLNKLSGRRHLVLGGICVIAPEKKPVTRLVTTKVQFKKLSEDEITRYLNSNEWQGKAGGYGIQGRAAAFIKNMQGSYSNVVGLSLYDIMQMLNGAGYKAE